MAEVLQPLMPTSSTIAMVHPPRPSSSDYQIPQQFPPSPRLAQQPRSMYNGGQNTGYRGVSGPVPSYAFQQPPQLRPDMRSISAHAVPGHRHVQSLSSSTTSSSDASSLPSTKDDSVMGSKHGSLVNFASVPDLSLTPFSPDTNAAVSADSAPKPTPGRYRRPASQRAESGNNPPKVSSPSLESPPTLVQLTKTDSLGQQPSAARPASADDMAAPKAGNLEVAKRYRRRSMNSLETQNMMQPQAGQAGLGAPLPSSPHGSTATSTPTSITPVFAHQRNVSGSSDTSQPAASHDASKHTDSPSKSTVPTTSATLRAAVTVPPRGSSEPSKRPANPSPLSKSAMDVEPAVAPPPRSPVAAPAKPTIATPSAAAQQLAAVSDKDFNKGMKSRLRRAFSFGSAQELRRAAGENYTANAQHAREQHHQRIEDGLDPEQLEIARRQEAAGIGASIYSGQGGFSGSTDNLSISSTASSASLMLRKMGKGAKRGAKSIKGLFRPKSVIGVPAADGPVAVQSSVALAATVGSVSMVTVEAERQVVNVNADPTERAGGGTGFPRLERNSIDAASQSGYMERGSGETADSQRRSIVGSDKDRAEVLAAVRKGILKRSSTSSPVGSPASRPVDERVPQFSDSPVSSMPSTPKDGQSARHGSLPVGGDYFAPKLAAGSKSMPNTPNGTVRSITFSPRIQFHDAWSSTEYDRRGEIATCNRLTPILAQQIKEELNTFKMEMEVHELSKPHTHFF